MNICYFEVTRRVIQGHYSARELSFVIFRQYSRVAVRFSGYTSINTINELTGSDN